MLIPTGSITIFWEESVCDLPAGVLTIDGRRTWDGGGHTSKDANHERKQKARRKSQEESEQRRRGAEEH
jgi:hypothetical protein